MPRKKKVSQEENFTDICYTISIPKLDDTAFSNFKSLLAGKEKIIMHAFGIEKLPIKEDENNLTFEWLLPNATQEEIHACMVLISKMAELSKNLKRVNLKKKKCLMRSMHLDVFF